MKLRDLGEFPFLRRLQQRVLRDARVQVGIGDDCAALFLSGTTLLTTDTLVENVHFRREWTTFPLLGEKAFAVNASDIAAMGGEPTFALLSLSVPQDTEVEDLDAFFDGFLRGAGTCNTALIGGNMSAAPCWMIAVTLLGHALHGIITRSGAQLGDDVYVTGTLGDAALGLRVLQEGQSGAHAEEAKARFLCPTSRIEISRSLATQHLATAMIDVSDGLLQDLGHICEASKVGAEIEGERLPLSPSYCALRGEREWDLALTGGEDYELLFTAPMTQRATIAEIAHATHSTITRIGRVTTHSQGIRVHAADGSVYITPQAGYDHFRAE
jgi:thiamine-monophosphate kinase